MIPFTITLKHNIDAPDKDSALMSFLETLIMNPTELNKDKLISITEVSEEK